LLPKVISLKLEASLIQKPVYNPPKVQFLKWVGSKHKFATEMVQYFPTEFNLYHEPFLGSGSILATIAPNDGFASDIYGPLVEIWQTLKSNPEEIISWYKTRYYQFLEGDRKEQYEIIKANFNNNPNGPDFLFLTRACWGGVIRFRKIDGYMSTPVGWHEPINVESFTIRVNEWHNRIKHVTFNCEDYKDAFKRALPGDFIYCDPPYQNSQSILYGSQKFDFNELLDCIAEAKQRNVFVAMSIDGHSRSGITQENQKIPFGLFEQEIDINDRISMLLRFKKFGQKLTIERDTEKLFLTY
jgi:DNA adenine methylase